MRIRTFIVTAALGAATVLAGAGVASADSDADGFAVGSPGFLSGNVIQVPIDVDANICGNSVNVIGLLNPAIGNYCSNH
ncbi:chaplin [Streptomyces sp. CB01635]|uniref:chaplin n=1 Tax=unclassified Streptomyces TaxID=2593676 RepID=UPI000C27123C|nr:chaplin [Streptomyces sp. CB01635]PJN11768.1 chaplin [Streptomyces sp. CB01635]